MTNLLKRHPYATLAICTFLYLYPFMRVIYPLKDEGTLLYGGVRILQGQVPYRDFFEVMGPGTFYWVALYFKLFGVTWFASRFGLMITCVTTAVLMLFLSRRILDRNKTFPVLLIIATLFGYSWPAVSHHGDSNLLALLSFSAFLLWLDYRRAIFLFAAGALAGLTTCFLQPKGILLFLAFMLLLGIRCRREAKTTAYIGWLTAGYCSVAVFVLAFFWHSGALDEFLYANFVWPLTRYSGVNSVPYGTSLWTIYRQIWAPALSAALGPSGGHLIASILIIPFLTIAALPIVLPIIALYQKFWAFHDPLVPYWVVGYALWFSEIHRKDIYHLVYGSPLLIILFFCLLNRSGWVIGALLAKIVAISSILLITLNICLTLAASTKMQTARGTVFMIKKDPILAFITEHVKPGDTLFSYSYSPMYYFLTGTNNPTKYSILMYQINTKAQFMDAVASLKNSDVSYVIWDDTANNEITRSIFPAYKPPRKEDRIIEQYLMSTFAVVYNANDVRVLKRRDKVAPEVSILRNAKKGQL